MRWHFAAQTLRTEVLGQDALQLRPGSGRWGQGAHLPRAGSLQASSVLSRIFPRALFDMFLKRNGGRVALGGP